MRTAVDINYCGIFAGRIESYRQHEAVIERCLPVGSSECAALDLGHTVFTPRAFALLKGLHQLGTGSGTEFHTTEYVRFRPAVGIKRTGRRKVGTVHTGTVVKERATTGIEVHTIDILTDVSALVGHQYQTACSRVESQQFKVLIGTGGQLTLLADTELPVRFLHMEYIEMVETVALALINEPRSVPGNEGKRVLGLHETGIRLGIEHTYTLAGLSGIGNKFAFVLAAGQLHKEDITLVGRPGNVGKVAVGGVSGIQIHGLSGSGVKHPYRHLMAGHACHGVLLGSKLRNLCGAVHLNVHKGKVGHHALVHTVEGKEPTFRAPEGTLLDTEFVAMDRRSVKQVTRTVGGHLQVLAIGSTNIEVIVLDISRAVGCRTELTVGCAAQCRLHPGNLPTFPVIFKQVLVALETNYHLLSTLKSGILKGAERIFGRGGTEHRIHLVAVEEESLGGCHGTSAAVGHQRTGIYTGAHQTLAPPCSRNVLRLQGPILVSAPHEFVKRGILQCLCHNESREKQCNDCKKISFHDSVFKRICE